jgi:hypothetical protein
MPPLAMNMRDRGPFLQLHCPAGEGIIGQFQQKTIFAGACLLVASGLSLVTVFELHANL